MCQIVKPAVLENISKWASFEPPFAKHLRIVMIMHLGNNLLRELFG